MSTKRIREFLEWYSKAMPSDASGAPPGGPKARAALEDLAAIELAAKALKRWNDNGGRGIDIDAAKGFGVIESIAKDAS